MNVKKYQGKTKEEAMAAAREELGKAAVIMNIKEVRPKGLGGLFKKSTFEVTAAIEEEELLKVRQSRPNPTMNVANMTSETHRFDAVIDDDTVANGKTVSMEELKNESKVAEADGNLGQDLKDAFAEVNKLLNGTQNSSKTDDASSIKETTVSSNDSLKKPLPTPTVEPKSIPQSPTYSRPTGARPVSPAGPQIQNVAPSQPEVKEVAKDLSKDQTILKMVYDVLLKNEVQERYINQMLEDVDSVMQSNNSIDKLISSVYQKMILKLGKPNVISLSNGPKVVFFVGPTGVGKTTTIAKVASKFKVEQNKHIAMLTADTYRIAATDQLKVYTDILKIPTEIVYTPDELAQQLSKFKKYDLILVDTAGFSHKNKSQREELENLLKGVPENVDSEVYLVLSATTKYKDITDIVDCYKGFTDFSIIFTKLDETNAYGNILNTKIYSEKDLSYVTTGQTVPDDIDVIDTQKLVKQLLGGQ